ncbi:MAG TPA: HAD-IIIC family phosphatase [Pirellulales bacterium]|jgi:FkbH-like protein|nr:HAD-IIIC family phosphatase [Pirellulales bacterium]
MALQLKRIAILCSFNLDLLKRPLSEVLAQAGVKSELYFTGYGLWEPEALDPQSPLHQFAPESVVLFADAADVLPPLHPGDQLSRRADAPAAAGAVWQRLTTVINGLLANLPQQSTLLVHNFVLPRLSALGTLEDNAGLSAGATLNILNDQLRALAESNPRVRIIDYANFVAEYGRNTLFDNRLWYLGRMHFGRGALNHVAALYARYLAALFTPRRKCLVLDLDNTLWGGVLGEDGPQGIALGQEGIGLAFREFQLAILALAQRGVILAVASKNNPADAWEVIDRHPEMILRRQDFACLEIHWNPKSESLPRIAETLNLALDSFVFWDDEPREREIVRTQHPAVFVPEVPADPSEYARALLNLDCFDVLNLTDEDRRRGKMYHQEADRQQWLTAASATNLGEFYRSLNMTICIAQPDAYAVPRFAQLTQRTNQFNFTTRRYTEGDIRAKLSDPSFGLYTISLEDRFGKLGLIGAAIVERQNKAWLLDTFLMSCRALGRGVEDAFLSMLATEAADAGLALHGTFISTKKNVPARQFLERLKIQLQAVGEENFTFQIDPAHVAFPSWIGKQDGSNSNGH